jgi:hypothetical protein
MPLFVYVKVNGNLYINRPDIPRLGETLREMVGELRSNGNGNRSIEIKRFSPTQIVKGKEIVKEIVREGLKAKYPLKRDELGRMVKP